MMDQNERSFIATDFSDFQELMDYDVENSFDRDFELKPTELHETVGTSHYEDLNTIASSLVNQLKHGESLMLNSMPKRKENVIYASSAPQPRRPTVGSKHGGETHFWPSCFSLMRRNWLIFYVTFVASLAFWSVGLLYANGFDIGIYPYWYI